jgi:MFS family permease
LLLSPSVLLVSTDLHTPVRPGAAGIAALYLSMLALGMGQTLIYTIIPVLGRELQLQELVVRLPFDLSWQPRELLITSLSALTAFIVAQTMPRWGQASDRLGRRNVMLLGLGGYIVGALVFASAGWIGLLGIVGGWMAYLALVFGRIVHALVMSASHPAAMAYMVDITTARQRVRSLGRLNAATQAGVMTGPLLVSFAAFHLLLPLLVQAVMTLVALLLVWRYLPDTGVRYRHHSEQRQLRYFDPRYRYFVIASFCTFTLMGVVMTTLAFYFQDLLQLTPAQAAQHFSVAIMLSSVAMMIAQLGLVRFVRSPITLMLIGLPIVGVGYALIAAASEIRLLTGGMVLYGLGMGLASPAFGTGASLTVTSEEQGSLAGVVGSASALGFLFGPLLGGYFYSLHHSLPYAAAALLIALLMIYLWRQRHSLTLERSAL